MTNYTKKALMNIGKVFTISIVAAFFGYLVRIFFARNLTVEEFGLFYAIIAFLSIIVIFVIFGLDRALIFFIPRFLAESNLQNVKNFIVNSAIVLFVHNIIIISILFFIADFLGKNFFHNDLASYVLMLMAISFFIDSFVLLIQTSFQGIQMMGIFSSINLVRMILILIISFIFFKLKFGLLSPIIAYLITPIILILIFLPLLYSKNYDIFTKTKYFWERKLFKKLYKYGFQMILLTVGGVILSHSDRLMLTFYRTLEDVGIYSVVFPTAMIFSYIPFTLAKVLIPITSELWGKGLILEFKKGVELIYRFYLIVLLPTSFLIFSFSYDLLEIFYGSSYTSGSFALKILAIGVIFFSLSNMNGSIFLGIGKQIVYTKIIIFGTVINIVLNIILIPRFGISGAAAATGLSFALMTFTGFFILVREKLAILPYTRWIKTLFVSLVFLLIVNYLNMHITINLFIKIPLILLISGLVYIVLLFLFKLIIFSEIKELLRRLNIA